MSLALAIAGLSLAILTAIIGSSWKLAILISSIDTKISQVLERITKLEVKHDMTTDDMQELTMKLAAAEQRLATAELDVFEIKKVLFYNKNGRPIHE